jgi:hypothetical protein
MALILLPRLEKELGLKASLVELLRRDLETVGADLRAEQARSRQLVVENQRLRLAAGQRDGQTAGSTVTPNGKAIFWLIPTMLSAGATLHRTLCGAVPEMSGLLIVNLFRCCFFFLHGRPTIVQKEDKYCIGLTFVVASHLFV